MAVKCAWMPIGLLAVCTAALAMPPPDDSNFKPSTSSFSGPTKIQFSGFCLRLETGETAERNQYVMWANHTTAKLKSGTLEIEENGSGGYAADPGKRIKKFTSGWLVRNREEGRLVYYFDDGMPGTTSIRYRSNHGSQRLEPVLNSFVFGPFCPA